MHVPKRTCNASCPLALFDLWSVAGPNNESRESVAVSLDKNREQARYGRDQRPATSFGQDAPARARVHGRASVGHYLEITRREGGGVPPPGNK